MKGFKDYIKESLLDDENNIVNKELSTEQQIALDIKEFFELYNIKELKYIVNSWNAYIEFDKVSKFDLFDFFNDKDYEIDFHGENEIRVKKDGYKITFEMHPDDITHNYNYVTGVYLPHIICDCLRKILKMFKESLLDNEDNIINKKTEFLTDKIKYIIACQDDPKAYWLKYFELQKWCDKGLKEDMVWLDDLDDAILYLEERKEERQALVFIDNNSQYGIYIIDLKSDKLLGLLYYTLSNRLDKVKQKVHQSIITPSWAYTSLYMIPKQYSIDIDDFYNDINESLLEPEADIVDKKFCYKVGSYYNDGKIEGIVASLKNSKNYSEPHLIMSLDEPKDTMTWDEAMEYNETLKDGWHIPSKEELEEVWYDDPRVTDILNKALEKYNGIELNRCYWSSSKCSIIDAVWFMNTYNGGIHNNLANYTYHVRPFVTL